MTSEQLNEKLRANPALRKANPHLAGVPSGSQPQQAVRHESLAAIPRTNGDGSRYAIRVCSYRIRLMDPDNLSGKWFVDSLRHGGLIPDDTAAIMDYSIRQQKVKSKEEECTMIEIERLAA